MDSTVAVQTNGLGFSFHAARNSLACCSSSTLKNESRRIRLLVNSANQRSIRLSQLNWLVHSGSQSADGLQPSLDVGVPVSTVVVHDQMEAGLARETHDQCDAETSETPDGDGAYDCPITLPCNRSRAANKVVVPFRL